MKFSHLTGIPRSSNRDFALVGRFPHVNVSSRFDGTFLFIKYMCDIFNDCRKAFDEKCNRNGSQINELVEQ